MINLGVFELLKKRQNKSTTHNENNASNEDNTCNKDNVSNEGKDSQFDAQGNANWYMRGI